MKISSRCSLGEHQNYLLKLNYIFVIRLFHVFVWLPVDFTFESESKDITLFWGKHSLSVLYLYRRVTYDFRMKRIYMRIYIRLPLPLPLPRPLYSPFTSALPTFLHSPDVIPSLPAQLRICLYICIYGRSFKLANRDLTSVIFRIYRQNMSFIHMHIH